MNGFLKSFGRNREKRLNKSMSLKEFFSDGFDRAEIVALRPVLTHFSSYNPLATSKPINGSLLIRQSLTFDQAFSSVPEFALIFTFR